VQTVFSGLSPLVIEDVVDEGERVVVRARTPQDTAVCPVCGASSGRVHGYHWRTVADVPVDGRRVVVRVRVRRLVCPTRGCRHTFREQVPGVLERYQRRTTRLASQVKAVVKELAGRAGARLLAILAVGLSRHTALRALLRIPLPTGRVPRVIGVDDFALRRRHRPTRSRTGSSRAAPSTYLISTPSPGAHSLIVVPIHARGVAVAAGAGQRAGRLGHSCMVRRPSASGPVECLASETTTPSAAARGPA
jgi:hypothetical protein